MFRKILIVFLMAPLLTAALATGTSFPILVVMFGLFLIALIGSSMRDEHQE